MGIHRQSAVVQSPKLQGSEIKTAPYRNGQTCNVHFPGFGRIPLPVSAVRPSRAGFLPNFGVFRFPWVPETRLSG